MKKGLSRYWEIDALRGFAVVEMMIYHLLFDVVYLGFFLLPLYAWWMRVFLFSIGGLFLLLVGASLSVAVPRLFEKNGERGVWRWAARRSLVIFSMGMLVSIGTFLWDSVCFVKFGVLHCIAVCILLSMPFQKKSCWWSFVGGSTMVLAGVLLTDVVIEIPYLFFVGLKYVGFCSLDFFPLLPWLGVVLWGVALGKVLYPAGKRRFDFKDHSGNVLVRFFTCLGRHSLVVYLIHQPVIVGVLLALSAIGWI